MRQSRFPCRMALLLLGTALLLSPAEAVQEGGRELRLLLPPFWGSAGPALGGGLSDLFGFCLRRVSRVRVISGREVFQSLPPHFGGHGLDIEEAAALGERHQASLVLTVHYEVHEDRLSYQVALGDLRGKRDWRRMSLEATAWAETHELHLRLARTVLELLNPPLLGPEERRMVTACGRPFPSREAVALHGEARRAEWEGHGEAASSIYARAGEAASGFALPFFRQGELFEILGSRWRAAGAYRRAIQADGRFVEAFKRLGDLLAENPRRLFEQALATYRQAVEIDPDYADAYVGLAETLGALGKVDEAIREYREASRVDPWNARAHVGLAHLYHVERGLFHEAVAEFEQALALDPAFLGAYLGLGDLLEEKGLYREAIARYRQVLDLKPTHTGALFAIARAYEKVDVEEAMARWRHYLEVASPLSSEREWLDIARGHLERLMRLRSEQGAVP